MMRKLDVVGPILKQTIPVLTTALSTSAWQCGIAGEQCTLPSFARRPAVVDKKGDLATLNEVGYQLRI